MAEALHAVPPVPAAPAEVLEAHLEGGGGEERSHGRVGTSGDCCLPALETEEGIPGSLRGVRRHGIGEPSHPKHRGQTNRGKPTKCPTQSDMLAPTVHKARLAPLTPPTVRAAHQAPCPSISYRAAVAYMAPRPSMLANVLLLHAQRGEAPGEVPPSWPRPC